ncbi:MAG: hypothetical protein NTW21_21700 [Verrucomicrobia bacterium]|nr:hypothetical protein [Verrucomicrobiota bacterium]
MTTKPLLRFDSHGLQIVTNGQLSETLCWASVLGVFAFKEDVFAYDIICIGFRTDDNGTYWKIDEECDGYKDLLGFLPMVFTGIRSDWFSDVAFPAFMPCVVSLWGQAQIDRIWRTEPVASATTTNPSQKRSRAILSDHTPFAMKLAHWIILAVLLVTPSALIVTYVCEFLAADSALDAGASYDYQAGRGDFTQSHPHLPFSERHPTFLALAGCSSACAVGYAAGLAIRRRRATAQTESSASVVDSPGNRG